MILAFASGSLRLVATPLEIKIKMSDRAVELGNVARSPHRDMRNIAHATTTTSSNEKVIQMAFLSNQKWRLRSSHSPRLTFNRLDTMYFLPAIQRELPHDLAQLGKPGDRKPGETWRQMKRFPSSQIDGLGFSCQ